jgi:N-acyl-D-aspartate/D-glutamate deacylase
MQHDVYDLVLRGGLVFDGRGSPPVHADVAVRDGRIAAIDPGLADSGKREVDAHDRWITPGFVDIHTHYDVELEVAPGLSESVRHGVTSVVIGNCSLSLAAGPADKLADVFLRVETMPAPLVRRWLQHAHTWQTPAEYLVHLRSLPLGPNVAALLGHSALRLAVMGLRRSLHEHATYDELVRMRELAEQALDAGCIGISVDLVHWHKVAGIYAGRSVPSHYADAREVRMLADVCRDRDAVFQATPNPRNPLTFLLILSLAIGLFRPPLRATVLSALDMSDYPQLWRLFPAVSFVINRLLGSNLRFQTLTEPFAIYGDGPITPLFEEFDSGVELNNCTTREQRQALWTDPQFRHRFRTDWLRREVRTFHRDPARMHILAAPDATYPGRTVEEIARMRQQAGVDALIDLLANYDTDLRWVTAGANERPAVRERLMAHPHILPGFTDAGAHAHNVAFFDGALALLRQAVQSGFMSPERAVERVTGEPARWFNLDAGVLRAGASADLVVLDPAALRTPSPAPVEIHDPLLDHAPRLVKRGSEAAIVAVYVNGTEVICAGEPTTALGTRGTGRVLTPVVTAQGRAAVLARYRNRLDNSNYDHPFTDYWQIFVFKHQDRANVLLHCLAVLMMYSALPLALLLNWWWLLLVPASQLTGLAGHLLFERSHVDTRDFLFTWRASRCLSRMFSRVLTGRYWRDVDAVQDLYRRFAKGHA